MLLRVAPDDLRGIAPRVRNAAAQLRELESAIAQLEMQLDSGVRVEAGVDGLISAARRTARGLADRLDSMQEFLSEAADAFQQADRAAASDFERMALAFRAARRDWMRDPTMRAWMVPWERTAGYLALGSLALPAASAARGSQQGPQVPGFIEGVWEQGVVEAAGVMGMALWAGRSLNLLDRRTFQAQWQTNISVGSFMIRHPGESLSAMWQGTTDPLVRDWAAGRRGEAIGRGAVLLASTVFGGKGVTRLARASRVAEVDAVADAATRMRLPTYTTGAARGILQTDAKEIDLISGVNGPARQMPGGAGSGLNWVTRTHVEGHAAALMHQLDLREAVLHINRVPCPSVHGCDHLLPRQLPTGARLRVIGPNDFDKTYIGVPE